MCVCVITYVRDNNMKLWAPTHSYANLICKNQPSDYRHQRIKTYIYTRTNLLNIRDQPEQITISLRKLQLIVCRNQLVEGKSPIMYLQLNGSTNPQLHLLAMSARRLQRINIFTRSNKKDNKTPNYFTIFNWKEAMTPWLFY